MVGWSRRSSESRARFNRWWATRTPEQKQAYLRHQAEVDRKFLRFCWFFFPIAITVMAWSCVTSVR